MIFYAPNVHVGGGLELLKLQLGALVSESGVVFVLDARVASIVDDYALKNVTFIEPNLISRLKGELYIRKISKQHESIFCFHGLPPIFLSGLDCNVLVYLQNRHYINRLSLNGNGFKHFIKLAFEKAVFNLFSYKVEEYFVQSRSMKRDSENNRFLRGKKVSVAPFFCMSSEFDDNEISFKVNDFIYVADANDHKNHMRLLEAWKMLSQKDVYPTLSLTLSEENKYNSYIQELINFHGCKILYLGVLSHEEVLLAYLKSRFLIYPSLVESFGLPLIEANKLGLPIVAGELDYVRDVVNPIQTFNPESATSICLAVLRALDIDSKIETVLKPEQFVQKILQRE